MNALMRRSSLEAPARRAQGARGTEDNGTPLARLIIPAERPAEDVPDALIRNVLYALDIAGATNQWLLNKAYTHYPKGHELQPALDLYTANREFGFALRNTREIIEGRRAMYASSNEPMPQQVSDNHLRMLLDAQAVMNKAVELADVFAQATFEADRARLAAARNEARLAGADGFWEAYAERVRGGFEAVNDAVKGAIIQAAQTAGKALNEGVRASFPWGWLAAAVVGAVVIGASMRGRRR